MTVPAAAQGVKLGLKIEGSLRWSLGSHCEITEAVYRTKQRAITGFYAGVSLNMPIRRSPHFSFQPEVVYLHRGYSIDNGVQKLRERDQYVELPLLVCYTRQNFFAEVGPQVGYLLYNNTQETSFGQQTEYSVAMHSEFNFSLGATAGVGYALPSGPSVGVRYTVSAGRYTGFSVLAGYVGYTFGNRRLQKG